MFPKLFKQVEGKKKIKSPFDIELLDMETLENRIEEMIKNPDPNTPKSRKARKFLIEQLLARGFKKIEVAERLKVSRKTVYNILKSTK